MKHSSKGFTLVELIGVIVILSLLITISTSVFINVRNSILEREYDNLVVYLESKAVEYANNSDITLISVGDLIKEGYVDPDDETDIYDPRNNKSLNCKLIELDYNNGEYVAELLENDNINEDGSCKEYTQTKNYQICQVQNGVCVGDLSNWLSDNVTLGVTFRGELIKEDAIYSWSTNTGFTSNDRFVDTFVRRAGEVYYTCEVVVDNDKGKAIKVVKIDKEAPIVISVLVNDNTLEVFGTDKDGSGIYGYSYVDVFDDCSHNKNDYTNGVLSYTEEGEYKFCAIDNVGNVSEGEIFLVDNKEPIITSKGDLTIKVKDSISLKDNFEVDCLGSKCSITCTIEETNTLDMGVYTPVCTVRRENGKTASAQMTLTVGSMQPSVPSVLTYYGGTTNTYDGSKTNKNIDVKISVGNANEVVTEYEYKVSTGDWISLGELDYINSDKIFTYTNEINDNIYVRACCSDGNTKLCSEEVSKKLYIDRTPSTPNVNLYYSGTSNSYNSSFTNKNIDFKITKGNSEDLVTKYQYKVGNGSWVNVGINSSYEGSFTYSSEVNSTFYVRACYVDGDSTKCSGTVSKTIKIDKTNPTCKVNVTTSGVTITGSDTNLDASGLSTTNSASYGTTSLGLSKNTFYGFVKDKAGNTGTCSKTIIGTTTTYKKTTSTCNETSTKSYTYDCSKSYDSCTGSWSNCSYCNTDKCRKYVASALPKTYTRTYKTCKQTSAAKYTCSISATTKNCTSLSASYSKCVNAGCKWSSYTSSCIGGTYKSCSSGTLSGSKCYSYNQSYCSAGWTSTVSTAAKYGWGTTYTSEVSSCTNSSPSCSSSSHVGNVYSSCAVKSYYCANGYNPQGTSCYTYGGYNGCSSGTDTGSGCVKYGVSSCPSGFSVSKTYTNYTYKYSASSSSQSNLSSCSASTGYSSCSGSYSSSQSSMKNKTNVTCTPSVACSSGYTKLNNTYCYK